MKVNTLIIWVLSSIFVQRGKSKISRNHVINNNETTSLNKSCSLCRRGIVTGLSELGSRMKMTLEIPRVCKLDKVCLAEARLTKL